MLRLILFFGTNIAVLVVASIVFQVLGLEQVLAQGGAQINLMGLLIFSAVIGMTGSFISLAISTLSRTYGHSSLPESVEAFGISGRVGAGLQRLLMSHPPLAERIEALKNVQ